MACSISITSVEGVVDSSDHLTGIRVQGITTECNRVEIRVSCLNRIVGGVNEYSVFVDLEPDGSWDTTIPVVPHLPCARCNSPITVTVACLVEGDIYDPDCPITTTTLSLPCPNEDCPTIRVDTSVSAHCNRDRTRTVVFSIHVDAPPTMLVTTQFSSGDGIDFPETSEREYHRLRDYDASTPGTYNPRIRIIRPEGCSDIELPPVNIPYCEPVEDIVPTGPRCPRIVNIIASDPIRSGDGCQVIWFAETDPANSPGTFTWYFDGETTGTTTREPMITKTYTSSGRKWVLVEYIPDMAGCVQSRWTGETEIEGCEPSEGESGGCIVGRIAMVAAMATALALVGLAICLSPPQPWLIAAGAFFLLFIVLAVIWGISCNPKPCNWLLLTTGQAFFGAGLLLVNMIGCCPTLAYVGAALAVVGIAMMIGWMASCNISLCRLALEFAAITGGVLLQIFIGIGFICGTPGFFEEPIPAVIAAIFNAFGIVTVVSGVACALGESGPPPVADPGLPGE